MLAKIFATVATGIVLSVISGCGGACSSEIVSTVPSPSGSQTAVVSIGDCGGATTDFFGTVDVVSEDPRLAAKGLYGFAGRPEETGLRIYWDSDTELRISINSLAKARRFHPDGRASADLKVEYEFRKLDDRD